MYYIKRENCGHLNAVGTEYQVFCSNCNKKLKNNYSDWIKSNSEKTFDDFLQLICISENEIPKNKEIPKYKISYTFYLIFKLNLIIGAAYFLYITMLKSNWDHQHPVSFIQWLGSISFFLFAIEEIIKYNRNVNKEIINDTQGK
jgi:hypothetical protein